VPGGTKLGVMFNVGTRVGVVIFATLNAGGSIASWQLPVSFLPSRRNFDLNLIATYLNTHKQSQVKEMVLWKEPTSN
jgi:hypothetical protein